MMDFSPDVGSRKRLQGKKPTEDVEMTLSSDFVSSTAEESKFNQQPIDQMLFIKFMRAKTVVKRRDRIILSMIGSNIHKRIRFAARKGSTGLFFQSLQRTEQFIDGNNHFILSKQTHMASILNDLGEHGISTFQYGIIYRRAEFIRMLVKVFPHLCNVSSLCGANLKLNLIPKEFRVAYRDCSSAMDMVVFALNHMDTLPHIKGVDRVGLLQDYFDLFTLLLRVPPPLPAWQSIGGPQQQQQQHTGLTTPSGSETNLADMVVQELQPDSDVMRTIAALAEAVNYNRFNDIANSVTTLNYQLLQLIPTIHNANVKINNLISRKAKQRSTPVAHRFSTSVMHEVILQYTAAIADLDLIDNIDLELEALTTLQDMISRNVFPPTSQDAYRAIHSSVFPLLHKYKKKYRHYFETLSAGESKLLSARGLYTVEACYWVLVSQYHFDGSAVVVSPSRDGRSGVPAERPSESGAVVVAESSSSSSKKSDVERQGSFSSVSAEQQQQQPKRKGSFREGAGAENTSDSICWNDLCRHMYHVYFNNNPMVVDNSLSWLTTVGVHCVPGLIAEHVETRCARLLTFLEMCKHVLHYHPKLSQTAAMDLFKAAQFLAEHFRFVVISSGRYFITEWIILHSAIEFVEVLSIDCSDSVLQQEMFTFLSELNHINITCIRRGTEVRGGSLTSVRSNKSGKSNYSLYSRPSLNHHSHVDECSGEAVNSVHLKTFEALCHMFYSANFERDIRAMCRDTLDEVSTLSDLYLCTCHINSAKTSRHSNNGKHNQILLSLLLSELPDVFVTINGVVDKQDLDNAKLLANVRELVEGCAAVKAKVKELTNTSLSLLNNEETLLSHFCLFVVIVYDQKYKAVLSI